MCAIELSVMVADGRRRRKGFAAEAVRLMIAYTARALRPSPSETARRPEGGARHSACVQRDQWSVVSFGKSRRTKTERGPSSPSARRDALFAARFCEACLFSLQGRETHAGRFFVKIDEANASSLALFAKLGFLRTNYAEAFQEVQMDLLLDAPPSAQLSRLSLSLSLGGCARSRLSRTRRATFLPRVPYVCEGKRARDGDVQRHRLASCFAQLEYLGHEFRLRSLAKRSKVF